MRAWREDLFAGLTVAVVGAPQCLAYAMMSGLPPAYGLVTAAVPGLVAALIGRSIGAITGPTNTTSLLILTTLAPYLGPNAMVGRDGLAVLATLTLLSGLVRLAAGAFGGAHLVRFLPESVLVGFTAGVAILIGVMQLDEALGIGPVVATGLGSETAGVIEALMGGQGPNPAAVALTLLTVLAVTSGQRQLPRYPLALLVVLASALLAFLFDLDQRWGLRLVGRRSPLAHGWPELTLPALDVALIESLITPAAAIVLLGTLELTAATRGESSRLDMRREILAQGWANVAGAFTSALPASVSLSRSALLRHGGVRTRLGAATAAVLSFAVLAFAAPIVGYIPQAALAGVLFATAFRMVDLVKFRRTWRASHATRLILVVTLGSALVFRLEWAILLGTSFSLIVYLADSSRPRLRAYMPVHDRLLPITGTDTPHIAVIEVSGELHFAAAQLFVTDAEALVPKSAKHVVVDLSHAHEMRFTALVALETLERDLKVRGAAMLLAGVPPEFIEVLVRAGSHLVAVPAHPEPGRSVQDALAIIAKMDLDSAYR